MAEVRIGHSFVSTKPDSADSSLVSANEWNADELFKNGSPGQTIIRDAGQVTGAKWVQGVSSVQTSGNAGGVVTSLPIAANPITFTTNCILLLMLYAQAITSAGQAVTLTMRRDAVTTLTPNWAGNGIGGIAIIDVRSEAPGTHTYDVVASVASGTITTVSVSLTALVIGVS